MNDFDEVIDEFIVESHEYLDQLDENFVELEREPHSRGIISEIFRAVHTIKGASGFLGFDKLGALTHEGESLLSLLRSGNLELTPEITTALLKLVDAIRTMLGFIERDRNDGPEPYEELVTTLRNLASADEQGPAPTTPVVEPQDVESSAESLPTDHEEDSIPGPNDDLSPQSAMSTTISAPSAITLKPLGQPVDPVEETVRSTIAESSIRVDVGLLDRLMNLVGELVLTRNQVVQYTASIVDGPFVTTTQRLNLITTELQAGVMKTRMQPIGNVWSKFPRVVRDLSLDCGKRVRLEMEGSDTELDKTIIEAIKDPLTHIVRNAIDHGIEAPDARAQAGKPLDGLLLMRAFHEGGQVNIEIVDDGAGIDAAKVKAKALEKGIVTPEQVARFSDEEIINLTFLPGFSTADKVTSVSGRGVGMDVVRTNIEKIGGTIEMQSRVGHGTTLKIKIPLTLAIIPALVVTAANAQYAIPQVNLLELVRLEGQSSDQIEIVGTVPVYRLRGRLLPILRLRDALRLPIDDNAEPSEETNIVVLQADGRQFGLVVDAINDTEEIVVKPLGRHLSGLGIYAGTTIMGDGSVALILDVLGIAQGARMVVEQRSDHSARTPLEEEERRSNRMAVVVCASGEQRIGVPLSLVARLEEFPRSLVEQAAGCDVVQYRGRLLPLVRLASNFDDSMYGEDHVLQVVVCVSEFGEAGIIVDQIVDIIDEEITIRSGANRNDIEFSGVVGRRVTDMLNINELLERNGITIGSCEYATTGV